MSGDHRNAHRHLNGHSHHHDSHSGNGDGVTKALWLALIFNFAFLIIELVVGLLTNSLALLSDAGHMVSDVAALALAIFVQRLAKAEPGGSFTFGYKRAPVVGAFGNAVTLLLIVFVIFWEAFNRLLNPSDIPGMPILIVGGAGLFVNVASAWWLHRNSDDSHNIRGAILHLFADALGSIGAIIAAVVLITTGWSFIDPLISFFIGGLILFSTWPLLRDTTKVLLEAAPSHLDVGKIRESLLNDSQVDEILDFHVWELDSDKLALSALLQTTSESLSILQEASDRLRLLLYENFGIYHCTFEWRNSASSVEGCNVNFPDLEV